MPVCDRNTLLGSVAAPEPEEGDGDVASEVSLAALAAFMVSLPVFAVLSTFSIAATMASSSLLEGVCRSAVGRLRTSVSAPETAAAAAMAGETRWVRPPLPCRPSKLRLEVDAQRSPGSSLSGFIARHIEQPGSRQSKPASRRILSRPSCSACAFTSPEPGTTMAYTCGATFRPFATAAAARISSMRALVQEPMKTLSTDRPSSATPGCRPMYSRLRRMEPARSSLAALAGSGTTAVMGTTSCGLVPQVTVGAMSEAGMMISLS
mmetsp:Transcript_3466/g.5404  ORF Transcript_3466/g.5404 Transcript_3466/m.5404 type:complete len:264 (+) Transcript_3466:642-1433(+)